MCPLSAGRFGKRKKNLCYFLGCCFVRLTVFLALQKICNFMSFHLLIVDLTACAISVLFRKTSLVWLHSSLFPTFFLSGFMLKSLIYFKIGSIKKSQTRVSFILKLGVYLFPWNKKKSRKVPVFKKILFERF